MSQRTAHNPQLETSSLCLWIQSLRLLFRFMRIEEESIWETSCREPQLAALFADR